MEIVTKVHARNLVAFAKERPQIVVLSADLTGSCEIAEFQQAYPDRFLSMGIAEQNMVSFAAGLAREGYRPYIHTFAVFIYRQALNQIVSSVAYSNLPVRFFGFLPGITTPGGATHQAIDDVSVLRSVPNMTILEPGDATEIENVLAIVEAQQGPVYVRMLRGEVPRLFPTDEPMALWPGAAAPGRDRPHPTHLRHLHRGGPAGSVGPRLAGALHRAPARLDPQALRRPEPAGRAFAGALRGHHHGEPPVVGGLGSEVAEVMAENGIGKPLRRIGLLDTFAHGGSRAHLMRCYGLDARALVEGVGGPGGRAARGPGR